MFQTTLAGEARISGLGIHGGQPATLTLRPAGADSGVVFVRTDVAGERRPIPALADKVCDTRLATVIGDGGPTISTVEHIMAALFGLGIDNAVIEIDGPEIPIMDGAAADFVAAIDAVGVRSLEAPRRYITITAPIEVAQSGKRAALLPAKRLRRVALGPWCTVYFESFATMLFQIQEMLLIEKGGAAQLADELAAYNPMIPQGAELTATVMFEIDDPVRRERVLGELGGVEDHFYLEVDGARASAVQEGDIERTREDGKTSSVHFLHFPLAPAQIAAFSAARVLIGCDHPRYAHMATLSDATRAELAKDLG